MPVTRRKASPAPKLITPVIESPFLTEKEVRQYMKCSKHEIRELVALKILKPIPYSHERVKPWRFLRSAVDQYIAVQAKAA
jgi:hypothetical protein